jgi:hypothetical protein
MIFCKDLGARDAGFRTAGVCDLAFVPLASGRRL